MIYKYKHSQSQVLKYVNYLTRTFNRIKEPKFFTYL